MKKIVFALVALASLSCLAEGAGEYGNEGSYGGSRPGAGWGGRTIVPALNIPLNLSQTDLNPSDLTVTASVLCKYKAGLFWPETKSCGHKSVEGLVSAEGVIQTPVITDSGLSRSSLDNMDIAIAVKKGDKYILNIIAYGKERAKNLISFRGSINVLKMQGGTLDIRLNGQDFFETEWTQVKGAYLHISIRSGSPQEYNQPLLMTSLSGWFTLVHDNRGLSSDKKLSNTKSITLPDTYFATTQDLQSSQIQAYVSYEDGMGPNRKNNFKAVKKVALETDSISKLGALELEAK